MSDLKPIVIADLRGGRNDADPPMSLRPDQATEFLNCDWKGTQFAHKRGGSIALSTTGGTAFNSTIDFLARHVPGASETAAELWAWDGDGAPLKRLTGGTSFADVTLDDAISGNVFDVAAASLNGKLFLAYDSAVDRLHVYDPNLSSPRVRRVSFATPAAPTVANTGAGAYAATLRYYRVRWLQLDSATSTIVIRRSLAGASVSFTPSGGGTDARITQPTPPGEGETHWEIEVSTDNLTWYWRVGRDAADNTSGMIAIATTTFDDSRVQANFPDGGTAYNTAGLNSRFPSVKYLISDGNRLLGAGSWEASGADSGGKTSRIWFTPVLGSTDKGDDERVPNQTTQKNWVDVNENDGGGVTGLAGPLNGIPWYFKYRQVGKLRPTGDVGTPYLPRKVRDDIGCINSRTIVMGEDQLGRPCVYFLSHRGPYRLTSDGDVQYVGRDNETTWRSMNLGASTVVGHAVYYPDLHQLWLWIATGASTTPDVRMVFDVQNGFPDEHGQIRGGWAKHTGDSAAARSSCLFSNTVGSAMSRDLKPHVGRSTGSTMLKCDTSDTDDNGTDFQAYVTTRPLLTSKDLLAKVGLAESMIVGKALAGSDVTLTISRNFGKETRATAINLGTANDGTALTTETRVVKKAEGSELGEADVIQITVGDSAANDEVWTVDLVVAPVIPQEPR